MRNEINTDINANGQKRYLYKNGGKLAIQNTGNVDVNLDVTAYIPFTFNSHGLYRGITPQINCNFTNNYFTNETYNVKSYNQELVARSILFEIGTEGNTLDEACRAAKLLGKELSQMITQK